jgi:glycosyltransferase involved in cell wall biosynthesis
MTINPEHQSPNPVNLSIAIATYGRDEVLADTLAALLMLESEPWDLLVIDQTPRHTPAVDQLLRSWQSEGRLRWISQTPASVTAAMNRALLEAKGTHVLFLDDDIIPDPDLLRAHRQACVRHPHTMIAGRVLQPWHQGVADSEASAFGFNSTTERPVLEFIGCNVCIPRDTALALGGFDQNFVRVAYRFEAEFSHRWRQAGYAIHYEPGALIHHLKAERGGTRSYGLHLTTLRPDHAVGRYYFLLRTLPLRTALAVAATTWMGTVRSRHHLRQPWWIPLTLTAELRGFLWALRLFRRGPHRLPAQPPRLLIVTSHPIQYQAPLFRALAAAPDLDTEVLFLTIPDQSEQGDGFGVAFEWDLPLRDGYRWRRAVSIAGAGLAAGFRGLRLRHPVRELLGGDRPPDAVLVMGWQVQGLVQILAAARRRGLPVLLRGESGDQPPRPWAVRLLHRLLLGQASAVLTVGEANDRFYRVNGVPEDRRFPSPYGVDNGFFAEGAAQWAPRRAELRARWAIPPQAFCFLFVGKLQEKKHPLDLLKALQQLVAQSEAPAVHLLIVGTGELEAACRAQVAAAALPVTFAGFLNQKEITAAYAVSDALVLPSGFGETWGLVVNEAMASGLPAIVSDRVGCARDLVHDAETGLVVPFRDVEALSAALGRMARHPEAAARMGRAARERVMARYGIAQAIEGVRQGLRRALLNDR